MIKNIIKKVVNFYNDFYQYCELALRFRIKSVKILRIIKLNLFPKMSFNMNFVACYYLKC